MKKYLWIILFFVTTLCFAQTNAAINQANTDNNFVIQLVDSKLVNLDNKIAAVAQSNQDGIADLKARTDEKLADKFKQLDDKGVYVGWWLNVLGIWLTIIGILAPFGAIWLNHKINKNIKDSQELLDKEIKNVTDQVKNKLLESDRLLTEMRGFHRNAEISASEIQDLAKKASSGSLTPEDSQKLKNDSNDLKNIPENQLTANDWFIKGLNAHSQKEYHDAITYFNNAIKLNNNEASNSQIYSNRGVAKFNLGLNDDAIRDYDKAISLDPKDKNNYFDKACVYALMKNKNEALKWLENALQLNYSVADVLKDEDWKIYLDDADFKSLIAKYNKQ